NDEYLTSVESTIRNLLIGHRIAKSFGSVMKVGYLPDQFGNISQMPQIFRGFGIDNCVFGRGWGLTAERRMEFWWQSPDGSRVLTSFMAFWYNNAQRLPSDPDTAERFLRALRDRMARHSATHHLLLMNGVDHLEAQDNLSAILAAVSHRLRPDTLVHSSLPDYIDAIRAESKDLPTFSGELREDRGGSVLAGTLSTRMYLKQANERCQTLLERYTEPFSAWAWACGAPYPSDFLTYAWKLLMQNHPHDSICGCSADQVHREMMPRFDRVRQVADEMLSRSLASIAAKIDTASVETMHGAGTRVTNVIVFNPLAWSRTDAVEAEIEFPLGEPSRGTPTVDHTRDVASLHLFDADDDPVPITVLENSIAYRRVLSPIELPMVMPVRRFRIAFTANDVPSLGYVTFKAVATPEPAPAVTPHIPCGNVMENEFLRVRVYPNGTLSLTDKRTGAEFRNLNLLESGGDVGDSYRYVAPLQDRIYTSAGAFGTLSVERTGPVSTFRVDYTLRLPAGATPDRCGRSEKMVDCPVTTRITLATSASRVDIETTVENRAKDHRLRALFPTDLAVDTSWAEGQFDVLQRPMLPPAEWGPHAAASYPQQSWCDVSDGGIGLAVLNQGLPEYQLYSCPDRSIALTLLRCVGTISGAGDAPGADPVPEAQCQGTYTFRYAVAPHRGFWSDALIWRQGHALTAPLLAVQTEDHDGMLPPTNSFLLLDPPELVLSAVKRAEDDELLVVRFYNISSEPVAGTLGIPGMVHAWTANLNEEKQDEIPVNEGLAAIEAGPKQIVTLLVMLEGRSS
ncbi:MAG: alpha-mannosidase, partial [Armatimonadota bacterium]